MIPGNLHDAGASCGDWLAKGSTSPTLPITGRLFCSPVANDPKSANDKKNYRLATLF